MSEARSVELTGATRAAGERQPRKTKPREASESRRPEPKEMASVLLDKKWRDSGATMTDEEAVAVILKALRAQAVKGEKE